MHNHDARHVARGVRAPPRAAARAGSRELERSGGSVIPDADTDVLHFTPEWLPTASWSPWRTCWWSCPRAHVDRGAWPTPSQFTIQASQEVPARSSRAERRLVPRAWQSRDQGAADFCKCPTLSSGAATRLDHLVNLRVRPRHSGSVLRPARAPAQCLARHKRAVCCTSGPE